MGRLFLLEIKKSHQTERELLTELAAYSQGLHDNFWGLGALDLIWVPISIDWRTMPTSAILNEMLCKVTPILPLKANVSMDGDHIKDVELELLSLAPLLTPNLARSIFNLKAFDCSIFSFATKPEDFESLLHYVTTEATRIGYSGFCFFAESNCPGYFPYSYHLVIGAQNPFKSRSVKDETDRLEGIASSHSNEGFFTTLEQLDLSEWEGFVISSENRLRSLSKALYSVFKMQGLDYEFSAPQLFALLEQGEFLTLNFVKSVDYFGLTREAMLLRLQWEFAHRNRDGEGPSFGVLEGCALRALSLPDTFFTFIELLKGDGKLH